MTEYVWDHRNRLISVTHYPTEGGPADLAVEYAYDHRNRWVRKILDPGGPGEEKTIFVYDGNQIALRFHDTGTADLTSADLKNRYLWGPSVDQILSDEQVTTYGTPGEVLWPLTDHLNTVRDVIESLATGNLTVGLTDFFGRLDKPVAKPLVISLGMIVYQVLASRLAKHGFAEEDHSLQRFLLDTPHEAFQVWIYPHRQLHPIATMGVELFG